MTTPATFQSRSGYRHPQWQSDAGGELADLTAVVDAAELMDAIFHQAGVSKNAKKRRELVAVTAMFLQAAQFGEQGIKKVNAMYAPVSDTLAFNGGDEEMGARTAHHQ